MIESLLGYIFTYWPLTFGAAIVAGIGISGALLSERRENRMRKMSDEEHMEFIFPRDRTGSTAVTSLSEVRRVMPAIIVGDDIVGVAPMVGPTPETLEHIKKLKEKKGKQNEYT